MATSKREVIQDQRGAIMGWKTTSSNGKSMYQNSKGTPVARVANNKTYGQTGQLKGKGDFGAKFL